MVYILQFVVAIYSTRDEKNSLENIYSAEESLGLNALNYNKWDKNVYEESSKIPEKVFWKLPSWKSVIFRMINFVITIIGIISTINMFRGYWFLLDEYFMHDHYELSLIHGQIYWALVLMACFASCSLHAGVFKDEYTGEKCLIEFYYTSYFYIKVKKKTSIPIIFLAFKLFEPLIVTLKHYFYSRDSMNKRKQKWQETTTCSKHLQ